MPLRPRLKQRLRGAGFKNAVALISILMAAFFLFNLPAGQEGRAGCNKVMGAKVQNSHYVHERIHANLVHLIQKMPAAVLSPSSSQHPARQICPSIIMAAMGKNALEAPGDFRSLTHPRQIMLHALPDPNAPGDSSDDSDS